MRKSLDMSNNIVIFWVHNVLEKDILIFITRLNVLVPSWE